MKQKIISLLKIMGLYKTYIVPDKVTKAFTKINEEQKSEIKNLTNEYCSISNYDSEENRQFDIEAISFFRLNRFRNNHIPFLYENIGLKGKNILEIGCGAGASSVALAEQGANVTGIDIDKKALDFAKKRANIYKQKINFVYSNATEINKLKNKNWDIIIYFASLEHMTPNERKNSLKQAFELIDNGKHICIFGTPNRLWPIDEHTSQIPFYMWLQDEIAIDYAKFSKRTEFSKISSDQNKKEFTDLYRWGRGVSFHEIQSALNDDSEIKIIDSLPIFLQRFSFLQKISYKRSLEYNYKSVISKMGPDKIHPGFYERYLDLIIEK